MPNNKLISFSGEIIMRFVKFTRTLTSKIRSIMPIFAAGFLGCLSLSPAAEAQRSWPGNPPAAIQEVLPVIEWDKRVNADERLKAFGTDLLGDSIDPHTGSLSFQHTDVSIPGNYDYLKVTKNKKRLTKRMLLGWGCQRTFEFCCEMGIK